MLLRLLPVLAVLGIVLPAALGGGLHWAWGDDGAMAQTLRVDSIRLVLESVQGAADPALRRLGEVLCVAEPGFIAHRHGVPPRCGSAL